MGADAEGNPLPQGEVGRLMTRGRTPSAAITKVHSTMPAPLMQRFLLFRRSDLY